jgi:hypothetical protein
MQCYVCALASDVSPAVGLCRVCSVGLCVEHLSENARRGGPGGMPAYDCLHTPNRDGDGGDGGRRVRGKDRVNALAAFAASVRGRRSFRDIGGAVRAYLQGQPRHQDARPGVLAAKR